MSEDLYLIEMADFYKRKLWSCYCYMEKVLISKDECKKKERCTGECRAFKSMSARYETKSFL